MLNLSKLALSATLIGGLAACTASADNMETDAASAVAPTATAKVKGLAPMATVKPGASVTMNTVLPKIMTSGSFQTVQLRFDEAYGSGVMTVTVAPSAGLSLFGGASSKTFDMASPDTHVWDVDVKADGDGVYFLNVFAEAQGQPRTFSVRLNIGQTTQKMFDDAVPADGEIADGGKIRVLEAEETIE